MDSEEDEDLARREARREEELERQDSLEYTDERMASHLGFTPKVQSLVAAHKETLAAKLAENTKRAERFGVDVVAPKVEAAVVLPQVSAKELKRALAASKQASFGAGIDPFSAEERAKRAERLEKFGPDAASASIFDPLFDPAVAEEEREKREAAARRAKRFAVPVFADEALATKVRRAVGPGSAYYEEKFVAVQAATERRDALFIRGYDPATGSLMPLGTGCIVAYFQALGTRVAWVEWMGDGMCNVVFEDTNGDEVPVVSKVVGMVGLAVPAVEGITAGDESTASAAMEATDLASGAGGSMEGIEGSEDAMSTQEPMTQEPSETAPIAAEGGEMGAAAAAAVAGPHWAARWHCARAPIVKINNDKYGAKGARVDFLMRLATSADLRPAAFNQKRKQGRRRQQQPKRKRKRGDSRRVVVSEDGMPMEQVGGGEGGGGGGGGGGMGRAARNDFVRTMPTMELDDEERERRRRRVDRFGGAPRASVFDRLGGGGGSSGSAAAAPAPAAVTAAAPAPAAAAPADADME